MQHSTPLYRVARPLLAPVFRALYRMKINNRNSLPAQGSFIVCSNHISLLDPVLLAMGQRRQMFYMAKAELFQNKLFSGLIRALGAFPVNRGKSDTAAISTAEEHLQNGNVLGIFIEGTRSKTGELQRPKSGAAMLAFQTHTPVVPVCLTCPDGIKPKLFHRTFLSFGEPMTPEELGLFEGTGPEFRNASRKIMDAIHALRERDVPKAGEELREDYSR